MNTPDIVTQQDELLYQKILFERPISRLQARKIGILAGRHAALKKINDFYRIVDALSHEPVIIAEQELKAHDIPARVYLHPSKKITEPFTNSDEAIAELLESSYVVVGMDIEISSRLQIFLEHLIASRHAPLIFTTESLPLFKISPELARGRRGDVYVCNTQSLTQLAKCLQIPVQFKPNAGIYNKIGLLRILAENLSAHIVCIEDYQILSLSFTNLDRAGVVNLSSTTALDYLYIPILTSLLCDVVNPEYDILERILTAGYLLRKSLGIDGDLVVNLKSIVRQD